MATAENVIRQLWEEGQGYTRGEQLAYIVEHRSHDIHIFDLFDSCVWYGLLNAMDMIVVANSIPDGHVFDRFQEMVMEMYSQQDMRDRAMQGVPIELQDIVSRQFDIIFGLDMIALLNDSLRPSCYIFRPLKDNSSTALTGDLLRLCM